jgi:hypothetical protein
VIDFKKVGEAAQSASSLTHHFYMMQGCKTAEEAFAARTAAIGRAAVAAMIPGDCIGCPFSEVHIWGNRCTQGWALELTTDGGEVETSPSPQCPAVKG